MQALGVGYFTRLAGNNVHPTVQLKKIGDNKYNLITESTFKNSEIKFEPGKEFDETTLDDRKVKSVSCEIKSTHFDEFKLNFNSFNFFP